MGTLTFVLGYAAVFAFSAVSVESKHVGCYYGVWAYTRPGLGEFWPEDIDTELCDYVYYGFGNILNDTYEMCSWDPWFDLGEQDYQDTTIRNCVQNRDGHEWLPGCVTDQGKPYCQYDGLRRTVALKQKNPDIKILFSVGGWTAGGDIFSRMAQTYETRQKFIRSAIHFLQYFGLDGLDVDWEFPAYDMLTLEETGPNDREHFTLLMKEMREAFDKNDPPFLLTIAGCQEPYKTERAYEIEKIWQYIDWINIMSYDYGGAWDNYTGIDAPIYGKWQESFQGHPKYGFDIHTIVQWYLDHGVPGNKLVLGIHTESKGWLLADEGTDNSGIYCPAYEASPNMTYSRQEGWLYYYEILQFWYNSTIEDPRWSDLVPGKENWVIHDNDNGGLDGCYLSPYTYQGRYWISYDDEYSVALKARYANHYGLLGAFVWEVDNDNFRGLFNYKPFTILQAINDAIVSGEGLVGDEIQGMPSENMNCPNQYALCEPPFTVTPGTVIPVTGTTTPQCTDDSHCNDDMNVVCDAEYTNCFYCDDDSLSCQPGCADDNNCLGGYLCNGNHECVKQGAEVLTSIKVKTKTCSGCVEGSSGLHLTLVGQYGMLFCQTNTLDNLEILDDYSDNHEAVFDGAPAGDNNDDGLGNCRYHDMNLGISQGTASWVGDGSWVPQATDPVCVTFYGADNPPCCCQFPAGTSISGDSGPANLLNCQCQF